MTFMPEARKIERITRLWHPNKNGDESPPEIIVDSGELSWWKCWVGHEWEATLSSVADRTANPCQICSGKATAGVNDLTTTHPSVAKEWHPTLNGELKPSEVLSTTKKKSFWWLCPRGHDWKASPSVRVSGSKSEDIISCSICRGRRFLSGFNDMATTHPELAAEWHPTKNENVTPSDIQSGSNKYAWWKCSLGHEWKVTPNSRARKYRGGGNFSSCPTCAGDIILTGFNDLATKNPELVKEWHPTKNTEIDPTAIHEWSSKKAWWKCNTKGHEWEATIASRSDGRGCSRCNFKQSKVETDLFEALLPTFPDAQHGVNLPAKWHHYSNSANVDIFVPSIHTAIEYDGAFWHQKKVAHDTKKTTALMEAGYKVIRVREDNLFFLNIDGCVELQHYAKKDSISNLAQRIYDSIESVKLQ